MMQMSSGHTVIAKFDKDGNFEGIYSSVDAATNNNFKPLVDSDGTLNYFTDSGVRAYSYIHPKTNEKIVEIEL